MARKKEKLDQVRARVQNHRRLKKMKMNHQKEVLRRMDFNQNDCDATDFIESCANINKANELKDKLRFWALRQRITHVALNALLSILRTSGFEFLPKDSRTLLRTPVVTPTATLSVGKMWYNGIQKCLKQIFSTISRDISITLDFNFDGMSVANSNNMQFWPILSSIRGNFKSRKNTLVFHANSYFVLQCLCM